MRSDPPSSPGLRTEGGTSVVVSEKINTGSRNENQEDCFRWTDKRRLLVCTQHVKAIKLLEPRHLFESGVQRGNAFVTDAVP